MLIALLPAAAAGCGGASTGGDGVSDADVGVETDGIIEDITQDGDDPAGDPLEDPTEDPAGDEAEAGECEPPMEFLCPCEDDEDCESGLCIHTETYGDICTTLCDGDCPEGWTCVVEDIDGDLVSVCLPYEDVYCIPCGDSGECGIDTDHCADVEGSVFCLEDCSGSGTCPEGYGCTAFPDDGWQLCVPDGGQCPGCIDGDEDGYGVGTDCPGTDCDDEDPDVYYGATEVCDGKDNNCNDATDEYCPGGECKEDYDGEGTVCASETQCVHDELVYENGEYSADCAGDEDRMKCQAGTWVTEACGEDSACADHYCSGGACEAAYTGPDTLCDDVFRCSSSSGDNGYNTAGFLRCLGFCDGAGNCDFAGSCENCSDSDGWYEYGDNGPGCIDMEDPVAERRVHTCADGDCDFSVAETLDCNGQDGFVGGGDTVGCGDDPASVKNDFFANESGECSSSVENCTIFDCDELDVCDTVCSETRVMEYADYFVVPNSDSCSAAYGPELYDCASLSTTETDGGPADYITGGNVTDYETCSDGNCTSTTYSDYCTDNTLYEYGADGSGYTGPTAFDCTSLGGQYCDDTRYLMGDIWICTGTPGYCFDDADVPTDCGVDGCEGTCGSGPNGCMWHDKGCADDDCFDTAHDADDEAGYCTTCSLTWLTFGSGTDSPCCGDDLDEDFEQAEAADRRCCYNAAVMDSLDSVASILCYNGLLYDCNDTADDDSGLATPRSTGDMIGGVECLASNTWGGGQCDYFDRPNTTDIPGWTERSGNWTIESNRLRSQATSSHQYITYDAEPARSNVCMTARAIYGTGASVRYIGFTGRFLDTNNLIQAKIQDNSTSGNFNKIFIYDEIGGGSSENLDITPTTDANIQLEMSGSNVTFRIDVDRNGTWDHTVTSTGCATNAGLIGATGYNGAYLDDWCYDDTCP